jgi:hypothetical protein
MTTNASDYVGVVEKLAALGCQYPAGIALLPANFKFAISVSELRQVSEAATVKTLLSAG